MASRKDLWEMASKAAEKKATAPLKWQGCGGDHSLRIRQGLGCRPVAGSSPTLHPRRQAGRPSRWSEFTGQELGPPLPERPVRVPIVRDRHHHVAGGDAAVSFQVGHEELVEPLLLFRTSWSAGDLHQHHVVAALDVQTSVLNDQVASGMGVHDLVPVALWDPETLNDRGMGRV